MGYPFHAFFFEKRRTEVRPVRGVVNHAADVDPPYSSHDGTLHYTYFPEEGS